MAEDLVVKRRFENVFVCQKCNATNRFGTGKPTRCRKCGSDRLRLKKKKKKSGA
jgi:ribosomal protein L40E